MDVTIPKSGSEIPHNCRLVAGDVARVGVPENHRVSRAKVTTPSAHVTKSRPSGNTDGER